MNLRISLQRTLLVALCFACICINGVAYFHAYKFTHFVEFEQVKTKAPAKLSMLEKLQILLFGISNPRPVNRITPHQPFTTIVLDGKPQIECWFIPNNQQKGTVAIFHGFSGCKDMMLDRADEFVAFGYNVLLVDFEGSGGSEGSQTSLGYWDSQTVQRCVQYLEANGEKNIILYGGSMGGTAILKALAETEINPKGSIVECPFGTLRQTAYARFAQMGVPGFPLADILIFWGGIQQGYCAFQHNPTEYAKKIQSPVLMLYGEQDKEVSKKEIKEIFENLSGKKYLRIYPHSKHESYLKNDREAWKQDVKLYLGELESKSQ